MYNRVDFSRVCALLRERDYSRRVQQREESNIVSDFVMMQASELNPNRIEPPC